MKRAFVFMIVFMFALFLLNSLSLAEEAEKKADEKAKVETKVEVYKIVKVSDKEIGEEQENEELEDDDDGENEDEDRVAYRELFEMIRRQNDQIQQLREEIGRLRRLIEERLQPQVRRGEGEQQPMNMDSEIRMLEEKVSKDPKNVDAHMRLAHLYDERGRIEAAISQYEMVTKIRPDFDPPYAALERLRNQRKEREARPEGEFNMGEVISSNMEYVTIKTFEGKTVAFRVPRVKKDDGSLVPMMDIPEKGARVRIFWNGVEGQKVIRRIEFLEREQREEAKPMEEYCMGEVISSSMEEVTIKTLENGETLTFRVPRVKKDDGSWVLNMDIAERAKSLDKGAKVKIFWNRVEDQRILRRIEFLNREGQEKE